ncbi:MAG: S8 family serine peptidase [Deltaproteobacteria bacterium]|nr:S8 family serine peptidase [Deltaproteobacteria bacterium]
MTKSRPRAMVFALAMALLPACVDAPGAGAPDLPDVVRAKAPDSLWTDVPARPFILALRPALGAATATEPDRKAALAAQKDRVLGVAEVTVDERWDELPLVQVRTATLDDAAALLAEDDVLAAYEVTTYALTDAESFPLINQPSAAGAGKIGTGTAVAVIDTGTDFTRAEFGACAAPGGACKVAFAKDFAADDGARDDNGHGTNVAGITVGVAPGTKILALDVFTGGGASSTDIISAINWAIASKPTYGIAAMNLSLGGGASTTTCPNDAMSIALGAARDAGIAPVVASGNNGYTNQISYPACAPAAISVGAVYDTNVGGLAYSACTDATTAADKITCFSNSASFLTLLAPGALITAGGTTMAGTSQATPHVAGAVAVLRAEYPTESVLQLLARLTSTGKRITDPRNSVTTPRIDVYAAVGAPPVDVTPPTGTVTINSGATLTNNRAVTLAITATDAGGLATMCVTNTTAACTPFETFATTKAWTLSTGDGAKTVLVYLRDKAGNTTTLGTSPAASITVDATAPTGGTATAASGDTKVVVSWTGFADAGSGIVGYRVVGGTTAAPPATCGGTLLYSGTGAAFTHTGLVNGTTYQYRICALDNAGNLSAGIVALGTARPESNPPVGTIALNGGASSTRTLALALTLTATDDTRVATMCLSEATTCTAFVAYAATATFTLPAGDGVRTVRAWFRDPWGNTSSPVIATIKVDTVLPTNGAVVATYGNAQASLTWSGFADAGTGVASYRVVVAPTTAPANCAGTTIYSGTALAFTHTGLTNGAAYAYRVCAVDGAGNVSAGAVSAVVTPRPESNPPVGTIAINGGASSTRTLALALTLTATDDTRVATMCLGEATTCTAFVPFAATATFTLPAGDGVRTVRAWFRDPWGNTSAPVTATIKVDTVLPTNGAVVATYGDAQVSLTWSGFADPGTGVAGYRVVVAPTTAPANCTGTTVYTGTALAFTHTGLTNGTAYAYRVCAIDGAGNVSAGAVSAVVTPRPESNPPVGTIAINGGALFSASLTVQLALAATDATSVATMCIAEATTCTAYVPYVPTKALTLAAGEGTHTVRVWYRDPWGNTSTPVTATIKVDTVAPTTGALAAAAAAGAINLTWPVATDATSGVASYRLVGASGTTAPATCAAGTLLYSGTDLAYAHATTGTWSYRVCAVDNAGNVSAGKIATATTP